MIAQKLVYDIDLYPSFRRKVSLGFVSDLLRLDLLRDSDVVHDMRPVYSVHERRPV